MTRKETLDRAEKCVCGAREGEYGTPEDNFKTIAKLWSIYLGHNVTAQDVAMCMTLLKIARVRSGNATADSFVDIAGYAACGAEITFPPPQIPEVRTKGDDPEDISGYLEALGGRYK